MNNQQFRRLLLDQSSSGPRPAPSPSSRNAGGATPALGSRQRSSIPMTPRTVGGVDFARQLREQQQKDAPPPSKKFKSSMAPKGSQLAAGYQDRAAALRGPADEVADDKEKRIRALEEQLKLQQIEPELFERLRDEIVGGDVSSVHLVKGLDRRLLERVRRGEDVLSAKVAEPEPEAPRTDADVEREFEDLEGMEVTPLAREAKARDMPPPARPAKRSRNEILAELKAQRASAKQEQALGPRFRKLGAPQPHAARMETDEKGREVLLVTDAAGNVKRKVRRAQPGDAHGLLVPDKGAAPLGMAVPDAPAAPQQEESGDIFADAGSDYNPLGGMDEAEASDSASDSASSDAAPPAETTKPPTRARRPSSASASASPRSRSRSAPRSSPSASPSPPPPAPSPQPRTPPRRNYFGTSSRRSPTAPTAPANPLADPATLAALKRAAALAGADPAAADPAPGASAATAAATAARHAAMLAGGDRDAYDVDLGFGSSRLEDEAEDEGGKLATWGEEGEEAKGRGGKGKERKRGRKKRKGDKNDVADVLRVMEGRKK